MHRSRTRVPGCLVSDGSTRCGCDGSAYRPDHAERPHGHGGFEVVRHTGTTRLESGKFLRWNGRSLDRAKRKRCQELGDSRALPGAKTIAKFHMQHLRGNNKVH